MGPHLSRETATEGQSGSSLNGYFVLLNRRLARLRAGRTADPQNVMHEGGLPRSTPLICRGLGGESATEGMYRILPCPRAEGGTASAIPDAMRAS